MNIINFLGFNLSTLSKTDLKFLTQDFQEATIL